MAWVYKESNNVDPLSLSEKQNNALLIYGQLNGYGWSLNAISGLLGNIERESYINPAQWQIGYTIGSTSAGFGLVQWTPSSKYINWANSANHNKYHGYWQVYCIDAQPYGTEWLQTSSFPITYDDFKTSNESVAYLTEAFLKNYERAGVEALQDRITKAEYWYTFLSGEEPPLPPEPDPDPSIITKSMPLWLMCKRIF